MIPDMTSEAPIEKPKRKKAKRAKPAKAAPPKPANQLAGLTKTECAKGCSVDGCVVSGKPYCSHPAKGGLQAGDLGNREVVERFQQAVKYLKRQALA